jgi:phospholipase/lecithinase/hemolysin
VKNLYLFTLGLCLFAAVPLPIRAAFSSLYVFGDSLSATNDNNPDTGSLGPPSYYGYRWSNGRVWIEVLAQRQGILINYNNSYFDHYSSITLADVNNFTAPPDVTNDLFVVWVCNADTFEAATTVVNDNNQDPNHLLNEFISANTASQINHFQIISNLYAKGVRTLIMPNAVDLSEIPSYNQGTVTGVLQAGCINYNVQFSNTISLFSNPTNYPGLTIYTPDFFTLLNNVMANAAYYGLLNAKSGGYSIDALTDLNPPTLNGPGTNYIFWDPKNPTAKFHAVIADETQKLLPQLARISKITPFIGSNRLDVVNMPGGLNGFAEGCTNLTLASWTTNLVGFASTNTTPSFFVPASGPQWFYRLRIPYYPYTWSWP